MIALPKPDEISHLQADARLRLETAIANARDAVVAQPDSPTAQCSLAEALFDAHQYQDGLAIATDAAAGAPADERPHVLVALLRLHMNDFPLALEAACRATSIAPESLKALAARAMAERASGDLAASARTVDQMSCTGDGCWELDYQRASQALFEQRYDDAAALADQARSQAPNEVLLINDQGVIALRRGLRADALRLFYLATIIDPITPRHNATCSSCVSATYRDGGSLARPSSRAR